MASESSTRLTHLGDAVGRLHGGEARWVASVPVHEEHEGQTLWTAVVEVFALEGNPAANRAYACKEPPQRAGGKPTVYAVLHAPPIHSAADAVRASIAVRQSAGVSTHANHAWHYERTRRTEPF